jgi:3-hydroxybutyryl-CoA dehydrogenase
LLFLPAKMEKTGKEIIGVVGAGTMGSGIAQVAAMAGHKALLFDTNIDAINKAKDELKKTLSRLVEKGKLTNDDSISIFENVVFINSMSELKDAGLIIEAIIENVSVKQKLFSDLESIVDKNCILASNTSSLSITSIASACKNPGRFIGLHFFNPAPLMPLVEIIPGITTEKIIVEKSKELISSWGKSAVVAKDTPGFIVNRIARPFYGEAIRIFEERWCGIPGDERGLATIDWAMREFGEFKMGPFELMDLIGNDVNYTVTETVWTQFFYDPRYKPSFTQKRLFEAKHFGRKSGKGYYTYGEGANVPEPIRDHDAGGKIFMRILAMLINEAADAFYYNVAGRDDIDLAMTKGVNYPKGLLKWCDEAGAEKILKILVALRTLYAEDRYRPSVLLQQMAERKQNFY